MFYELTHGNYSLDDALAMDEIVKVGKSWRVAGRRNVKAQRERSAAARKAARANAR